MIFKRSPLASAISITAGALRRDSYFDDVRELAEIVRQHFAGPLILGGTGFSVSPLGWMRRLDADCGVVGEGEQVFLEVLARLEKGQPLDGIDGVVLRAKKCRARRLGAGQGH